MSIEAVLIAALGVAFGLVMLAYRGGSKLSNRVNRPGRAIQWDAPAADA